MFTMKTRIAPPGQHRVALTAVEETTGQYGGPALKWVFAVRGGPHAGTELVKITGTDPRLGSTLGDLLCGLYGRSLVPGETVDPAADLAGREFDAFAVPGNGTGAVLQTIRPAATA